MHRDHEHVSEDSAEAVVACPEANTCRRWRTPGWRAAAWRRTPCPPPRCRACSRRGCPQPAAACASGMPTAPPPLAAPRACRKEHKHSWTAVLLASEPAGDSSTAGAYAAVRQAARPSLECVCESSHLHACCARAAQQAWLAAHHQGSRATAARTAGSLAAAAPTVAPPKEWPTIARRCMSNLPAHDYEQSS
jgi:hypothetical protein